MKKKKYISGIKRVIRALEKDVERQLDPTYKALLTFDNAQAVEILDNAKAKLNKVDGDETFKPWETIR